MHRKTIFPTVRPQTLNWRSSISRLRASVPVIGAFSALLLGGMHTAQAANEAWSTAPASGNFSGINWNAGTTTPTAPPANTIAAGDALYFGTSSITALTDDEAAGFSLAGFTFNAGASAYTIAGNAFALTGNITNNSASLETINDAFTIAAGTSFSTTTGNLTLGGNITGTGLGTATLATGGGTVTLGGTDSFTSAGGKGNALQVIGGSTLAITGNTTLSLSANDYFSDGQGTAANAGTVTVAAGGTMNVTGAGRFIVGTFSSGTLNVNGTANFLGTAPLRLGYSTGQTVNSIVNLNAGGLLATANAITIDNANAALAATFNFNGGTLRAGAAGLTLLAPTGTGTMTVTTSSTASTVDPNGFVTTISAPIVNGATAGGLTIADSSTAKNGTLILTGANTYTGATTVNTGTLQLGNGAAVGSIAGTSIVVNNNGTTTNGVLAFNSTAAESYAGVVSGTGGVTQAGTGNTTLSGANTYTGATTVNAGTLTLSGSLANASTLALGGGTFAYAPTTAGSTQTLAGTVINPGNSAVTVTTGNTLNLGTITRAGNGLINFGTTGGTITTSNAGTGGILGPYAYTNTGTNLRYVSSGTVAPYTGGTAAATAAGVTDTTGTVNYDVAAGGTTGAGASANTLRYTGAADTITGPITLNGLMNAGTGALTVNGALTAGSTNELVVLSNGQNVTLNGAVGNNGANASALTYGGPGAGTLTLTAANTYTGATTINSGTFQLGNGGTTGSLSGSSTIIDNGALIFNRSNAVTQGTDFGAAAITGTGTLTQVGTGMTTLTAAETYAGATTISAGTLQLGNGGTTGSLATTSTITDNGNLTFNRSNAVTQGTDFSAAALTGTGSLTQAGTGTTTLNAINTFTGGTTVNAGTLVLNNGGGSGVVRGVLTVNTGATLNLAANNALGYTAGQQVATLNINGGTVNTTSTAGVNEGFVTSFNLTGGTLAYTGAASSVNNSYQIDAGNAVAPSITSNASATTSLISGGINIRSGSLPINVAAGTTASGVDLTISGAIYGSGNTGAGTAFGITKNGAGYLNLTGQSVFPGNVVINAGTVNIGSVAPNDGSTSALGLVNIANKTITVGTGATLSGNVNNQFGTATNANLPTITVNGGTLSTIRYSAVGALNLNGATVTINDTVDTGGYQTYALRGNVAVGGTAATTINSVTSGATTGGIHLNTNTVFTVATTGATGADFVVNAPFRNQSPDYGSLAGGLTKAGAGSMLLTAVSTYTGTTSVTAGTLLISGSVASAAVSVTGGALTLSNTTATAIADTSTLSLSSGTALNLNANAGTSEFIGSLVLDGTTEPNGTYTAAQLTTLDSAITFSSLNGETLTVVPEPSTWVGMVVLVGLVGVTQRRRFTAGV